MPIAVKSLQLFYVDKGKSSDTKRNRLKTKSAVNNPINDFLDIKTDHKIAAIKICFLHRWRINVAQYSSFIQIDKTNLYSE